MSRVYLMSTVRQMASRLAPNSVPEPQWDPVPPKGALVTQGSTVSAAEQLAWTLLFLPSWNSFRSIGLKKAVLHALAGKSLFSRCDVLPFHLETRLWALIDLSFFRDVSIPYKLELFSSSCFNL